MSAPSNFFDRRIDKMLTLAIWGHDGQHRDGLHEPYVLHPYRVARALEQDGEAAWLVEAGLGHDLLEDTAVTEQRLREEGVSELAIQTIKMVTKSWKGTPPAGAKVAYYAGMDGPARRLKVHDRIDNLQDMARGVLLGTIKPERLGRYLKKTQVEIEPLARLEMMLTRLGDAQDIAVKALATKGAFMDFLAMS